MLATLPLSYCTNVHPGRSLAEVVAGLRDYTAPLQRKVGRPIAAGLWLAQPVIRELTGGPRAVDELREPLAGAGLACYTLNAFPFGDFHSARVKEQVYLPDWSQPARLDYTRDCARVLARLLPEGCEGSLSTVPLGFKGFAHPLDFRARCIAQLLELAGDLKRLEHETGRRIRLAIEPEPFCVLETTAETLSFFDELRRAAERAGQLDVAREYLGVCYDVCHQAVEFEDVAESIRQLRRAEVRIVKVHITCAIQVDDPADPAAREALARYVEPRYLHQTLALGRDGIVRRSVDLSGELCGQPPREFLDAPQWRVHFHVPVDAERLGPLSTTRQQLREALQAVAALDYAPHLEVETYTWEVLPDAAGDPRQRLIDGFTREMQATGRLLEAAGGDSESRFQN